MLKIYSKNRLNKKENNEIYNLLFETYKTKKSEKKKIIEIKQTPKKKFLIAKIENQIIGFLILLDRSFYFFEKKITITGMSYMVVKKKFHKLKVGNILINKMLILNKNTDIFLGFARRLMDNYYTRYGFVGVTNFSKLTVKTDDIKIINVKLLKVFKAKKKDIGSIKKIYDISKKKSVGYFERDSEIWNYYFKNKLNYNFYSILNKRKIIGYFIETENLITELNCVKKYEKEFIYSIKEFYRKKNKTEIFIESNINSPAVNFLLKNYNNFLSKRFAWNGGHILKINNFRKFAGKITKLIKSNISKVGLTEFRFRLKYLKISINKKKIQYKLNEKLLRNYSNQIEFTKYIFGLHRSKNNLVNLIFPRTNTNFSKIDHF